MASHVPLHRDLAHDPGMFPDWESNQGPFVSQASTQSTEPHQPGLHINFVSCNYTRFICSNSFLTFKKICVGFCVYTLVVRQSHTLHSIPLDISSSPSSTIRGYHNIDIFYAFLNSCDYFVATNLCSLVPSPLSPSDPTLPSISGNYQFSPCIYESI